MKTLTLLLTVVFLTSCTFTPDQKEKAAATGSLILKRIERIAISTILNSAVSQLDRENKSNYLDGLAAAFWTQPIVTSEDAKQLVAIWTPDKSHWQTLGNQLADQIRQGVTPNQIAEGLSKVK